MGGGCCWVVVVEVDMGMSPISQLTQHRLKVMLLIQFQCQGLIPPSLKGRLVAGQKQTIAPKF